MKPYRIPQLAKPYTDYDMIQRHAELPPFPDVRGHLLYIFLNHGASGPQHNGELYTLVTTLVQLGLDTHEVIDRSNGDSDKDTMRSRQLKVLAGDYFSSWFYQLLAKSEQIEMVGTLSTAIAELNVMKANLYSKMRRMLLTAEQYLRHTVQLNMQLFLSFTPLIEESVADLWQSLLREFCHCETVVMELRRSVEPTGAIDGYCYLHLLNAVTEDEKPLLQNQNIDHRDWKKLTMKYKCDSLLKDKLHQSVETIQGILQGVKDESLIKELSAVLDRFLLQMKITGQAAGEG
ncbi:heptaprenyl diphosphate synthase component 1 [Paenibacillus wynnii]|uniref:heptaprenyl diphosphate synthase component 1 n=1 Tax=Paenibacillus wynnii TaxID=268407 RepID=UPI00278EBB42|nr:heptaprenyl diphosphate synthase component 1 [Paenibacillus wynnii]MDQ0192993.1 heptaprenyl diphosphate synthase [Paenibacillus wynnii]